MQSAIARLVFNLFFLLACSPLLAAEADDVASNDPDFLIQGEYLGEVMRPIGKETIGIQVIALGDGKFRAVAFHGGLPGDGWDKSPKLECEGETLNGVTSFKNGEYSAKIKNGTMVLSAEGGVTLGELQKVSRQSTTYDAKAPEDAVIIFDGKNTDALEKGRMTEDGLLMQGALSKYKFNDGTLHLEFQLPFQPKRRGQDRGNSGCYLQGRYELQILDSFGLKGENNECGGFYTQKSPDLNMCYPPLAWQTYDIDFTAPKFEEGKKVKNAVVTVRHNGVVIHDKFELPSETPGGISKESPEPGPLMLQDHNEPVRFRNIWFQERKPEN